MSTPLGIEMKTTALPMVADKDGQRVADALSNVLADTFILYLKTHSFHWNVTGPMFHTLHQMFEEQYNELWLAVDAIAERMRSLGFIAPGSYGEFTKRTYLQESPNPRNASEMIAELLTDHERLQGLLAQRLRLHTWLLMRQPKIFLRNG